MPYFGSRPLRLWLAGITIFGTVEGTTNVTVNQAMLLYRVLARRETFLPRLP